MNFHEIIVMAIAILGIQAGVFKRPQPSLDGTYVLTMQKILNEGQPIVPGFKLKSYGRVGE